MSGLSQAVKEREIMTSGRLRRAALLAAALLGTFFPGRTAMGYLTADAARDNLISLAESRISVEETYDPPGTLEPGQRFVKAPRVKNLSAVPVSVRVRVSFSSGEAAALCRLDGFSGDWTRGADGYFYFGHALAPGEETPPLFSEVAVEETATPEEIQEALPFDIYVYAESVLAGEGAWEKAGGEGP